MKEYTVEVQVRFGDTDAYGHVNNATFFTYMEMARFAFIKDHLIDLMKNSIVFLVVKADCEYKLPIGLVDRVFVSVSLEEVGNSSFVLYYRLHNGSDKLFATGRTVIVTFDSKTNKTIPVPSAIVEIFREGNGKNTIPL